MESNKKNKSLSSKGSGFQGEKDEKEVTTKGKFIINQDVQQKKEKSLEAVSEEEISKTFDKIQNSPKEVKRALLLIETWKDKIEFLEKYEQGLVVVEEIEEKDENGVLEKIIYQANMEMIKKAERRQQLTALSYELTPIYKRIFDSSSWEEREKLIELNKEGKLPPIQRGIIDDENEEE